MKKLLLAAISLVALQSNIKGETEEECKEIVTKAIAYLSCIKNHAALGERGCAVAHWSLKLSGKEAVKKINSGVCDKYDK